jgi:hypothetical protein
MKKVNAKRKLQGSFKEISQVLQDENARKRRKKNLLVSVTR